jgi:ATP-dependent RNA helicase DDX10/DBP4
MVKSKSKPNSTNKISPQEEIAALNARIAVETPDRGTVPHGKNSVVAFGSLPLSQPTLQGLEANSYSIMTSIQSASIPHTLAARDILGAAKTGSGKTLAFLIPLLESLYRQGWSTHDGIGAIVLSPTRELAGQIFAVLRKIGRYHKFTLGLLMGGRNKSRKETGNDFINEQQSIPTTNILICTPGRLLQHLEQTPYMNVDGLQMLVLDEADRILDLGFRDQLVRILDYLPQERQTLLFSATQTKDVKHLATLSINRKTVEYVGVQDQEESMTPDQLKQSYVLVPVEHKLNCVYSFLKSHLKCKTIVFMASCSQVRHAWELFCRLRPGLSVLAMHGKLSQTKRLQVYDKFTTTPHSVMFATDVASRGLDFPNIDWVVQVDAPEDPDMYVHRVGRTARFRRQGQALLLLDPLEEVCVKQWQMKTPLRKKSINPTKTMLVSQRASSLVAEHNVLYKLAKKAFLSYVRSISLLPKNVWGDLNVREMNLEAYALSLGMSSLPNLSFLDKVTNREGLRETKNVNRKLQKLKEQIRLEKEKKKGEKDKKRKVADKEEDEEEEDDLLVVKARHEYNDQDDDDTTNVPLGSTRVRKAKRIRIDGGGLQAKNQHTIFEEDGTEQSKLLQGGSNTSDEDDDEAGVDSKQLQQANESYLDQVRERLEQTRDLDKKEERDRIRAKHKKKRMQEKAEQDEEKEGREEGAGATATLAPTLEMGDDDDASAASSSDDSASSNDKRGESSSSEDEDEDVDVAQQEDMALALIRGQA